MSSRPCLHGTPSAVTLSVWFHICLDFQVLNTGLLGKIWIWQISVSHFFGGYTHLSQRTCLNLINSCYLWFSKLSGLGVGWRDGWLFPTPICWLNSGTPLSQLHRFWVLMLFLILFGIFLPCWSSVIRSGWLSLCIAFLINNFLPIPTAASPSSYSLWLTSAFSSSALSASHCQNPNLALMKTTPAFLTGLLQNFSKFVLKC